MNGQDFPRHLIRALSPPRLATGTLLALALLSAACSDQASRITSAQHLDGFSSVQAAASSFTVLANAAVTCTDGSIIGDVGTFETAPPGAITLTRCPVTGTTHIGDPAAVAAYNAFLSEYLALAPLPSDVCTQTFSDATTLAGVTLSPGLYCFPAAATLTGQLTLSGPSNGIWTFKIGTEGTGALTGTNFSVVMAGGAQQCNVTWWVSQAATMTTSAFVGNILAGAAITMTGPGTTYGNVWAGASGVGDVTNGTDILPGTSLTGCAISNGNGQGNGQDKSQSKCNQGVGNGPESCDPGNSNHMHGSNDENGGTPGDPGRKGGK